MEIKDNRIKASEGMILTNGNAYAEIVSLGVGDSPENWHEITEMEYNDIINREMEMNLL